MKTKGTLLLLSILTITMFFYSFNRPGQIDRKSELTDTLDIHKMVLSEYEKIYYMGMDADTINQVTANLLLADSFTLKQNIDYRKSQIADSIRLTEVESKKQYYERTVYLLDSIAKSAGQNVNDIISYKYEYTKCTVSPVRTQYEDSKVTTKLMTSSATTWFFTDATPTRQIIRSPDESKNNVLNPIEYPDYYRKIDREIVVQTDLVQNINI